MPSWRLENTNEIREEAPYTFYRPSDDIIDKLKPGETTVKLIFSFESDEPEDPSAERMWVIMDSVDEDGNYSGTLDNAPFHIKDLSEGDSIVFRREHIIQYDTLEELIVEDPLAEVIQKFTKKCFVSNHIMNEGYLVGRLYREEIDDEDYSGWTMMSDYETQEYVDDVTNLQYISIGKVLNLDDSFIHLLDEPIGSEFSKDDETGSYLPVV
ncbi:DUF2185 domain-containing protein [Pedobacter cryoconitis]|uniref:immunity protein Imm33 domain-containing protein n=1 Tax=Pedobacter cryoconitis TaxID=188932 RepID=UPI00161E0172|nr:DUF2185 domain-containing protein [Pedobacter cryoconitis]MBB5645895.1 hypothetical protein [Pedobacter cryoconitis]